MSEIRSLVDAQRLVFDFERVLCDANIPIISGSALEAVCLNIVDIYDQYLHPEKRPSGIVDIRPAFRDFLGLTDLAAKVTSISKHKEFAKFESHLKLLGSGNPVQNSASSVLNQSNNKLFELFIGCLCIRAMCDSIELDDPESAAGNNPDVIASFSGKLWGFGCKSLHSKAPHTVFDNLEKAVIQIERSAAETGMPVLSAKNILNHDALWPAGPDPDAPNELVFGAFTSTADPICMLRKEVQDLKNSLVNEVGKESLKQIYFGKKSKPVCLLYCPTATTILMNNIPTPTRLNMFELLIFGPLDDETCLIAKKLNMQLQILIGSMGP